MDRRTESLLEGFALNPGLLSESEIEQVSRLLEESQEAAYLFRYFQAFYAEFNSAGYSFVSEKVRAFLSGLLDSGRVVRLKPRTSTIRDARSGTVLQQRMAAASGVRRKFELLGSSLSADDNINIRFLHDVDNQVVRVFVVSEESSAYADAMVMFEDSGVFLITNEKGEARMEYEVFMGLHLLEREVFLRPMTEQIAIEAAELASSLSPLPYKSEFQIKANLANDRLTLIVQEDICTVICRLDESPDWILLPTGEPWTFEGAGKSRLSLRIYG